MRVSVFQFSIVLPIIALIVGCKPCAAPKDTVKTAYIHKYGVEVPDADDFISRGGTGEVITTQKNGIIAHETYLDQKLHGTSSWTFPHSETIERVKRYNQGTLIEEVKHYLSGAPQQKSVYHKNGTRVTSWYEDGTPRSIENFTTDAHLIGGEYFTAACELESSVKDGAGTRMIRDGLGQLVAKEEITNGLLGLQETYHTNGSPLAQIPYVNGKIHGIKRTFYAGGEPKTVEEWNAGELHGCMQLYQNGARIAEVPYVHGKKQGIETRFKEGSSVIAEQITWLEGKRHGPSTICVDANTKLTDWYFANEKVSKIHYVELASETHLARE
ncbi:MAG: hypothetical protein JWO53_1060 [Chlamydiia bacterium]|nr:hypothetical protein [Chlamydiia bacterium]